MHRPGGSLLLALLLAAGCLAAPQPPGDGADGAPAPQPGRALPPVGAPAFGEAALVTTIDALVPQEEPLLHRAPDGALLLSTPHVPALFRSGDGGATWATLFDDRAGGGEGEPTEGRTDAAFANGAGGALHWLGLFGESHDLPFQTSLDGGRTWSAAVELAEAGDVDRQWIAALPDGRIVATWATPDRLALRTSPDGGATWTRTAGLQDEPGFPGPPLAAEGTFWLPYSTHLDGGRVRVARSDDGGATWAVANATPPLLAGVTLQYGPVVTIVPTLARDAAGNLYMAYAADDPPAPGPYVGKPVVQQAVFLARSADGGATWSEPLRLSLPGQNAVMPWVVAGAEGRVAVAFYESLTGATREGASAWFTVLAVSGDAAAAAPTWHRAATSELPAHVGTICNECGDFSRLDHLGLALDAAGAPVVAWVRDGAANPRALDIMASRAGNVVLE